MFFSLLSVLLVAIAAGETYGVSITPALVASTWIFLTIYALRLVLRGAWRRWSPQLGAAWQLWSPRLRAIAEATDPLLRKRPVPVPGLVRITNNVPRSTSTTFSAS
jgi:hypothetical protein